MKKTKIIATIGPASESPEVIEKLALAGMNVCRLNFSFGTHDEHKKKIDMIRSVSKKIGYPIGILLDLQGPKIRIGQLNEPVTIKRGEEIILSGNNKHKERFYLPTTYRQIASDTVNGKTILIADGKIILKVIKTDKKKKEVYCKTIQGGTILTGKGINLPYTEISLPALTEKDKEDVMFGIETGVDYMGLSFVRKAEDVLQLKRILKKAKNRIPVIAKIEKPEALINLEKILEVADGVMVARGDLAGEISFEKVPPAQKEIIHKANKNGKITIVATEMLNSMVENPLPTRAEASDVANAIFDGADAVMLSNETAMGKFPEKAVKAMNAIAIEAEKSFSYITPSNKELNFPEVHEQTNALCSAASFLSYKLNEKALCVITRSGTSVRWLSKYRPQSRIFAATENKILYNQLALLHNVSPILIENNENKNDVIGVVKKLLITNKCLKKGSMVIFLSGTHSKGNDSWQTDTVTLQILDGE